MNEHVSEHLSDQSLRVVNDIYEDVYVQHGAIKADSHITHFQQGGMLLLHHQEKQEDTCNRLYLR